MSKEERARKYAKSYLDELSTEAKTLLEEIHQKQRKYNQLRKQIQGLEWFISPEDENDKSLPSAELSPQEIKDEIAELLKNIYPEPLHYTKILKHLNNKGIAIPGKDEKQNLLSYLSRDNRFQGTGVRGEYTINKEFFGIDDEETA